MSQTVVDDTTATIEPEVKKKKTRAIKTKKPIGSARSRKAKLKFPIGRVDGMLKRGNYVSRVGAGTPVYLAAVMEYIVAEIIELAGNAAYDNKFNTIIPRHIKLAIGQDDELNFLFKGVCISAGGVIPSVITSKKHKKKNDE